MFERFRPDGQVAVVTGAGRGIGRGIALALAEAGADVALAGRTVAQLEETAHTVEALGRRALVVPTDVTVSEQVERLADRAASELGHLDILVNNAGILVDQEAQAIRDDDWLRVIDTNLNSVMRCARAAARYMIPQQRGSIVNIASIFAYTPAPRFSSYVAAKGGMISFTRALALEWARYKVRVNAIAPGYVHTELNEWALSNPQIRDGLIRATPLRRLGTPEDIGLAVVYLASPAADYMTGEIVVLDGGYVIR
ncbi:MAG: SDR family oxidoreductase [Chloroflexi bacterium]|nr:SDR family oxidoreductase [Chloroflexota bacterium]